MKTINKRRPGALDDQHHMSLEQIAVQLFIDGDTPRVFSREAIRKILNSAIEKAQTMPVSFDADKILDELRDDPEMYHGE